MQTVSIRKRMLARERENARGKVAQRFPATFIALMTSSSASGHLHKAQSRDFQKYTKFSAGGESTSVSQAAAL